MFASGKNFGYKQSAVRRLPLVAATILLAALVAVSSVHGTEPSEDSPPIHITSDKMVVETAARSAEFTGSVRAVQETTVITADRLKVYYKSQEGPEQADQGETEAAVEKIVCSGQVVIHFDNKVAVCDKAVYTATDAVLVLTGPAAKVTSEKNSVTGEKITVYRNEDRMVVESGQERRVEAVIFSKGKGLK